MIWLAPILILFITFIIFYHRINNKQPERIFNVYTQPGKWFLLKFFTFYLVIMLRRLKFKLKPPSLEDLEKMKPLSEHEKAFDATFFQGVSQKGIYFCGGIERRHRAKGCGLFYLVVPQMGVLESLKLPNTQLDLDPGSVLLMKDYSAEGISFTPIEPMKRWTVSFRGQMRLQKDPTKLVNVKLEGEFISDLPYFLSERDCHPIALAKAVATEKWNRDFFNLLKSNHQSHYEQMGYFNGAVEIDGKIYFLEMDAFRDHSYGYKRDWSSMHRYIFHMIYLTDGTKLCMGIFSQPVTISHMLMGYVVTPDGTLTTIKRSDLVLYQHAENGTPPNDYAFSFQTNKDLYEVKVKVLHDAVHFKGNNTEAKLFERFIECEVNDIKGRGISEWQYNNFKTENNPS